MSPRAGEEIYLSELEVEIMSVFVQNGILDDDEVIKVLRGLEGKLSNE